MHGPRVSWSALCNGPCGHSLKVNEGKVSSPGLTSRLFTGHITKRQTISIVRRCASGKLETHHSPPSTRWQSALQWTSGALFQAVDCWIFHSLLASTRSCPSRCWQCCSFSGTPHTLPSLRLPEDSIKVLCSRHPEWAEGADLLAESVPRASAQKKGGGWVRKTQQGCGMIDSREPS